MTTDVSIELRKREQLLNVVERRSLVAPLELRENEATGELILEGYAATYDAYDVHGGPDAGGWVEQLSRRAFDATLAEGADVQLLINHGGEPLARTPHGGQPGTMKLSADDHGLYVYASLEPTDPDVMRIKPKMMRRDMDEMSFAFRVTEQDWDGSYTTRTISQLSLQKGDVSVVNYGMNPNTKAIIQVGEAMGALAQLSSKELLEVRSKIDHDQVRRARAALAMIDEVPPHKKHPKHPATPGVVKGYGGIRIVTQSVPDTDDGPGGEDDNDAPGTAEDEGTEAASRADKKPYGNVTYADPGYKDDGRKRYPIDTEEHARSAWSYINMPKNQKGYTASQVDGIKTRIRSALKKFGVDVNDDSGKSNLTGCDVSHIEAQRNAAGGTTLVAVMTDGSRVPLPPQSRDVDLNLQPAGEGRVLAAPVPFTGNPFAGQPLVKGPGDPHDMAFSKGPEVGDVPGDRPNLTVGSGEGLDAVEPNKGGPAVMKELLAKDDEPANEPENEPDADDEKKGMDEECDDTMPGDDNPDHEAKSDDMDETAYDPETGEGRTDMEPDPDDEANSIDLGMAAALDRTIVHAYQLSADADVRKLLETARTQLNNLRGITGGPATDISRKMDELRSEVGLPDTGSVSEGLKYLRSEGTLPVGYLGLIVKADPECHVTTAAERLAYEAKDKAVRATEDATAADLRLKEARRLAELNGAIARRKLRDAVK